MNDGMGNSVLFLKVRETCRHSEDNKFVASQTPAFPCCTWTHTFPPRAPILPRKRAEICKQSPLHFSSVHFWHFDPAGWPPISCSITKNVIHEAVTNNGATAQAAKWKVPVHQRPTQIMLGHILLFFAVAMFWSCFGLGRCHSHKRKIGGT